MRISDVILGSAVALTGFAGQAHAGMGLGGTDSLADKLLAGIGIPEAHQATDSCSDFSGSWIAKCDLSADGSVLTTIAIQQKGCDFLVVDGEYIGVGGGFTETTASSNSGIHADVLADWSAGGKSLTVTKSVSGRKLGEAKFLSMTSVGTLTLAGDKISETGTYSYSLSDSGKISAQSNGNVSCSFERQ